MNRHTETDAQDDALTREASDFHPTDYLRMLYRRRRLAALVFVVVFVGGVFNSLKTVPVYEAKSQVIIESERAGITALNEMFGEPTPARADDFLQTEYQVLQSRTLARRTLDRLKLWEHVEFGGRKPGAAPGSADPAWWVAVRDRWQWGVRDSVVHLIPPAALPVAAEVPRDPRLPASSPPQESNREFRTIDAFLSKLRVSPLRNSRIVEVRFRSTDPAFAARVANGLAEEYITQNVEARFDTSREAVDWLQQQLDEQRRKVEESEAELQKYKEKHRAVAVVDRQNIVVQKLADLNAAVTRAKTDRIQKESVYNQVQALQRSGAPLDTFPGIQANTFVQGLKTELAALRKQEAELAGRYGERHPDIVKVRAAIQAATQKVDLEIAKAVESLRLDHLSAVAHEQSLSQALESQKSEALGLNRVEIEYAVLERDAASNRQVYESLLQRAKEAGLSGELKANSIRILDPAETPRAPVLPNRRRDILVALALGLSLGVGVAFFFEYLDNRIKSPEDVRIHLGVPLLGMVPAVKLRKRDDDVLVTTCGSPRYAEALRTVRTNVLFSTLKPARRSIAVTSSCQGEGKTLFAANFAITLASAGERVLLIDADLRQPQVSTLFRCRQSPGLSNLLTGSAKASAAIGMTRIRGLWVLPSGPPPPNPAELIGSPRFSELIDKLGELFDWVVIDTPPVLAVTDAVLIAHAVSGVVFVVAADMTNRKSCTAAIDQLAAADANIVGAVLNRVDLDRNGYYYGTYYRQRDERYYGATPAVPEPGILSEPLIGAKGAQAGPVGDGLERL